MSARIKLKKLEEYLQGVDAFSKPKILLEQYETPSHIASCLLHTIQTKYDDLEGKVVADLGCGSGMLSIGAFLMGATHVVGFEIDADAIADFRTNLEEMEIDSQIDIVQCDVTADLEATLGPDAERRFDTVLMNPPFGTKRNSGLDVKFVEMGVRMATNAVYSLHKTSTRDFIKKKALDLGTKPEIVAQLRYNIEASYKFHKKQSVDIEVDVWRFGIVNDES